MKVNIKREVLDFGFQNIKFTNGLDLDKVRLRYGWLLNARIKNAIIGESTDNKLIWYSGEWLCGEWFDGYWYSGVFHQGIWRNGDWYSYQLDLSQARNGVLYIEDDASNDNSHFLSGTWIYGTHHNGTFGLNENYWDTQTKYDINYTVLTNYNLDWDTTESNCIWKYGNFLDGIFINSRWEYGNFYNGKMINSWWENGLFYNGTFEDHTWITGKWYGGDFLQGKWYDGIFTEIGDNLSRFGINSGNGYIVSRWYDGIFLAGEFHSGLKEISGITFPSEEHLSSRWYEGTFKGGIWYGGQFEQGDWITGTWKDGIWGTWVTENWYYPNLALIHETGNTQWTYTENLTGYTDEYAYLQTTGVSLLTSGWTYSNILSFGNWRDTNGNSFDLPSGSTITGMQTKIERSAYYNTTLGGTTDNVVSMYNYNIPASGSNYATQTDFFTSDKQTIYYGRFENYWIEGTGSTQTTWISNLTSELFNDDQMFFLYGTTNYKYEYMSPVFDMYAKLYNIGLRVFYYTSPTWYNGTWENGLWINGTWENGDFLQGTWLNGTFVNGTMGSVST